jgi:hypothetical protein
VAASLEPQLVHVRADVAASETILPAYGLPTTDPGTPRRACAPPAATSTARLRRVSSADQEAEHDLGVHSFGYFLWPPAWLGEGLKDAPAAEPRGVWDRIAEAELSDEITAWCHRNGIFAFDLEGWAPGSPAPVEAHPMEITQEHQRARATLLNTHLACLYTASKRIDGRQLSPMLVTQGDILHYHHNAEVFSASGTLAITEVLRANWNTRLGPPPAGDWRFLRETNVLSRKAIASAYDLLSAILTNEQFTRILPVSDLALRAAVAHMSRTFDASLIQSWAAVERLLTDVWERYIADNRGRPLDGSSGVFINGKRKEILTGRDFPISVVSETLSLLNLISFEQYQRLRPVRQARNSWIHALSPVPAGASAQALHLAFDLLRSVYGIDLDPVPEVMLGSGL